MNDLDNQYKQQEQFSESAKRHKKAGKRMLVISWVLVLGVAFILFSWYGEKQKGAYNTRTVLTDTGAIELYIPLTDGNRYEVFGKINNEKILFLIDTGATSVAIPESVANSAGLKRGMAIDMVTAGGVKVAYLTKIAKLTIGEDIVLTNVIATINPEMPKDTILLGMGALKQLQFVHTKNTLILRQNQP